MSYQVIARKWRPQTFEEVTGQEAITRTLRNAVEHERFHHAYLFSGARGVGKTTTARLLAKALNCRRTDKPNPVPCSPADPGACDSCREIAEGRSLDVLEIDAASNTGVDNVREVIINNIQIAPARDRYKVFIIDEVHMLSTSSFNALLKTLEEPPGNVVFIMATTELHKVPDTILSRCQEFEFRIIATVKILERLKFIAEAEKISIDPEALRDVARAGEGSMRDAQSAFDQVISFSGEHISSEDVTSALGLASAEILIRTVNSIASKHSSGLLFVVDDLISRGHDLRNFCRDVLALFRDLLVTKLSDSAELVETSAVDSETLKKLSGDFSEADLIRFFSSLSETETKLKEATEARYVLEVGLMKLLEMRRVVEIEKLIERLGEIESTARADNANHTAPASPSRTPAASIPEKKTLAADFDFNGVPFPVANGALRATERDAPPALDPEEIGGGPRPNWVPANSVRGNGPVIESSPADILSTEFFDSLPVKLLPISSEDLEHVDDAWLDSTYEYRLQREGDDLKPVAEAATLAAMLIGERKQTSNGSAPPARLNGNSTLSVQIFEPEAISDEVPILPESPTQEDLWRYAENHPHTKKVMRIFRAKIVDVKQERAGN
jgi:DNA polymerase III subunit gamma/tau